jgi:hypothetical protein
LLPPRVRLLSNGIPFPLNKKNSQPCRELKWHATESSYGHLCGLWLHCMGPSIDVSPLSKCFIPFYFYIQITSGIYGTLYGEQYVACVNLLRSLASSMTYFVMLASISFV